MQHDWIPSTLGHGETMCRRCFVTNREAAALGISNECDVPEPAPKPANENAPSREWTQDEVDEQMFSDNDEDGDDGWAECGRWNNGRLSQQCRKAGSEECDWECPIMLPTRRGLKRATR